jgi:predicted MFS family arabinose efflux permease
LVMVPLVFGHETGWAWWTWACLAAAVPTAVALALHLRRADAPVADLRLFARPRFGLGMAAATAVMIAYGGFLFVLTLHLQQELGDSPLRSGLTFAPYALGFAITSLTVPLLTASVQRRVAPLGLALSAAGYAGLGLAAAGDGGWSDASALPLLALAGAGFGAGYSQVIARAVAGVPAARAHDASGLFNTINMLGFALGVATLGSAYLSGASLQAITALCGALSLVGAAVTLLLARSERDPSVKAVARPAVGSETMAA